MSFEVGRLFATIELDDQPFNRDIGRARTQLTGLVDTAKTVGRGMSKAFTAAGVATAATTVNLLKQGGAYNQLQQNSRAALKSIMKGAKAANAQMDKLDEFATKSPFSKAVFITAQQQLLGFGMSAEKVLPTLDAIQNAVAATGGSSQQVGELAYVIAQIQSAGKITGQDLMQMGVRGVDAAKLIGESLGKTSDEVRQMITKGQLDVDTALDALTKGMSNKFAGATANIKKQMSGATDRVKAATRDIGAELAKPFIDPHGGGRAVVWVNRYADALRGVQRITGEVMGWVNRRFDQAFKGIDSTLAGVSSALARVDTSKLTSGLDSLVKYGPLLSTVAAGMTAVALRGVPVLGAVNPMIAAFAALAATSKPVQQALANIAGAAAGLARPLGEFARAVGDLLLDALQRSAPLLEAFGRLAVATVDGLIPLGMAAVGVVHALLPLVSALTGITNAIANIPAPLLAAGAAFLLLKTQMGGINKAMKGAHTAITTVVGAWKEHRAISEMVVRDIPNVTAKTAMLQAGMASAKMAVKGLGAAMKTALISNLPALALTGLIMVLGQFVAAKQKARQATQEFKDSLDAETGAVTENTAAWARKQSEDYVDYAKQIGVSIETVQQALMGEKEALEEVNAAAEAYQRTANIQSYNGKLSLSQAKEKTDALRNQNAASREAQQAALDTIPPEQRVTETIKEQTRIINENRKASETRANARGSLKDAEYAVADAQQRVNDMLEAGKTGTLEHERAIKNLVDARNRELEAMAKAGKSQDELNARSGQSKAELEELARAYLKARDGVDASDEAVQQFLESLGLIPEKKTTRIELDKNASDQEIAAFIDRMKNGKATIPLNIDDAPAMEGLAGLIGVLDSENGVLTVDADTDPAVLKAIATLGYIDGETGQFVITADAETVEETVKQIQDDIATTTMVIGVDVNGEQAEEKINLLEVLAAAGVDKPVRADIELARFAVETLNQAVEDEAIKPVDANTVAALIKNGDLEAALQMLSTKPVDADTKEAISKNLALAAQIRQQATKPVDADTKSANSKIATTQGNARQPVSVPVSAHDATPGGIGATVRSWFPATVSVGVRAAQMLGLAQADGGVVDYFANGSEHHVAQIAPAGAWRVWAEPETGGEAYIPLSRAKRARSTRILSEVADRFGYKLTPTRAQRFADGGTTTTTSAANSSVLPQRVVVQIGGREFEAYATEIADKAVIRSFNMAGV
ncbi:MAG: tape measure protein [Actinomyces sp.]|nr:tape measure protein [Actinomyces sp.]